MARMIINKISSKLYYVDCVLILYMFLSNMTSTYGVYLPFHKYNIVLIFAITMLGIINQIILKKIKMNSFILTCLFLLILISITSFVFIINKNWSFKYAFLQFISSILWILILIFAYSVSTYDPDVINHIKNMVFILPIYLIAYIKIKIFSNNTGISQISGVYYLMFMLPLIFLNKNNYIKIVGISIIIYTLVLSQKRTGLLAMTAFLLSYYIFYYRMKSEDIKGSLRRILIFTIAIVAIVGLLYLASKDLNIEILNKMKRIKSDEGSGRIDIWMKVIESIKNTEINKLIFGNGFNAVYYNLGMNLSAHNDFLEIIYDYGILGIFLYILMLGQLSKRGFQLLKEKNYLAPSFLASIVFILVFSISSHAVIYPTYFLVFCLFWGYCISINNKEGRKDEKNKLDCTSI